MSVKAEIAWDVAPYAAIAGLIVVAYLLLQKAFQQNATPFSIDLNPNASFSIFGNKATGGQNTIGNSANPNTPGAAGTPQVTPPGAVPDGSTGDPVQDAAAAGAALGAEFSSAGTGLEDDLATLADAAGNIFDSGSPAVVTQ
jgi:hypothetical protein